LRNYPKAPSIWIRSRGIVKRCTPTALHPYLKAGYRLIASRGKARHETDYQQRLQSELAHFGGDVETLPQIAHYWSAKFLVPTLQPFGFTNAIELFRSYIERRCLQVPDERCICLSLGCGDSASELNIATWLRERGIVNFHFECYDVNPDVLKRGHNAAIRSGLAPHFTFNTFDINTWRPSRQYPIVLAFQSLHHIVELELLFANIRKAMTPGGYFLADDMIGRNGHQRWPEALEMIHRLWQKLPDRYKYNRQLQRFEESYENWDCSQSGFEGIRSQDILGLLLQNFNFEVFVPFGNLIDVFIDRGFGHNFDPANAWDTAFIDEVHELDVKCLESGILKPTHMLAAMTTGAVQNPVIHKHLSPEFCLRRVLTTR
jgi:SAM-dependent methyltransferase